MDISSVSLSTASSSSSTSTIIPDLQTQIEQLEAREKGHQAEVSKLTQNEDTAGKNKDRISVLEAQIELLRVQIERMKAQKLMQKVEEKADLNVGANDQVQSGNQTKGNIKKVEDLADASLSVKSEINHNLDVTV